MDIARELRECLALQEQIDAKVLELRSRYKAVLEAERKRGNLRTIVVKIDGQMYCLEREDASKRSYRDAMETARKLQGFYMYRLFKIGNVVE